MKVQVDGDDEYGKWAEGKAADLWWHKDLIFSSFVDYDKVMTALEQALLEARGEAIDEMGEELKNDTDLSFEWNYEDWRDAIDELIRKLKSKGGKDG